MTSHPNLLDSDNSVLLLVDMQTRLSAVMPVDDAARMASHTQRLLQAAKLLEVPVLVTEQYPQGLGSTQPEISACLPMLTPLFSKTGFSCCAAEGFNQALAATGRQQVVVIGQEAHVCVLQTVLELLSQNYQVFVLTDAVCSRQTEHKLYALQRMQQQGATLSCHESVLFEWLRDARHMHFKAISALLR